MNFTITVPEIKELFSLIKEEPAKLFEMMELSIQKQVGNYLSKLMDIELTNHLGKKPYQRNKQTDISLKPKNYRNGSYNRKFFIINIGEVETKVLRDLKQRVSYKSAATKASRYDKRLSNDLYAIVYPV